MLERWKLNRSRRQARKKYAKTRKAYLADKTKTGDDLNELLEASVHEDEAIDDEFALFYSERLRKDAEEHDIEIPSKIDGLDVWHFTDDGERGFLSAKAREVFRKTIDAEKARRFEVKTLWVTKIILPLAGILVGLIGAATGFIAVWRHGK